MIKQWLVGVALVALVVSVAGAQQGQGQGRRGGGGFSGRGGGTSLTGLLRNEAVQKELGLDEAAVAKARTVGEEYQALVQSELEKAGISFEGLRDLPEAERNAKMTELREKSEAVTAKLAGTLKEKLKGALSAEQVTRLQQIQWQASGAEAVGSGELAAALGLTDEQKTKIATAIRENAAKVRELFAAGGGGGEEARTKRAELRKELETAVTGALTADQQAKLADLKGKPFDVAQLNAGGQGGRGRRGNDNNGNNN